jgi:dynein heavy chain
VTSPCLYHPGTCSPEPSRPENNLTRSEPFPRGLCLSAQEDKDRVAADIREWVLALGGSASKDACYASFIGRVRDNLHIVLTMSPVGEAFRAR